MSIYPTNTVLGPEKTCQDKRYVDLQMLTYTQNCIYNVKGTGFGTLQIRQHILSVEIPDVEITSVGCIKFWSYKSLRNLVLLFYIEKNVFCNK